MEVKTVGVYGAGSMGRGIAQVALEGGYDVVLYNHRTPTLEKGVAGINKNFDKKIAKGKIDEAQKTEWLSHLKATTTLEDLADVDIVFEAMVENMGYVECPHCGEKIYPFGESRLADLAKEYHVNLTAALPIDPKLAAACDKGDIEAFEGNWLDGITDVIQNL